MKILKAFQLPRPWSEKKKTKNFHILIFDFLCVAKYIEGWLKTYTSYLVQRKIWLNFPLKNCQFFDIVLWMVATMAPKTIPKKKLTPCHISNGLQLSTNICN
jgi:hypothetical protein